MDKRLDNLDENDKKKLIFKTPVECDVFYFSYAKAVGFGLCWSDWVCLTFPAKGISNLPNIYTHEEP